MQFNLSGSGVLLLPLALQLAGLTFAVVIDPYL